MLRGQPLRSSVPTPLRPRGWGKVTPSCPTPSTHSWEAHKVFVGVGSQLVQVLGPEHGVGKQAGQRHGREGAHLLRPGQAEQGEHQEHGVPGTCTQRDTEGKAGAQTTRCPFPASPSPAPRG